MDNNLTNGTKMQSWTCKFWVVSFALIALYQFQIFRIISLFISQRKEKLCIYSFGFQNFQKLRISNTAYNTVSGRFLLIILMQLIRSNKIKGNQDRTMAIIDNNFINNNLIKLINPKISTQPNGTLLQNKNIFSFNNWIKYKLSNT